MVHYLIFFSLIYHVLDVGVNPNIQVFQCTGERSFHKTLSSSGIVLCEKQCSSFQLLSKIIYFYNVSYKLS